MSSYHPLLASINCIILLALSTAASAAVSLSGSASVTFADSELNTTTGAASLTIAGTRGSTSTSATLDLVTGAMSRATMSTSIGPVAFSATLDTEQPSTLLGTMRINEYDDGCLYNLVGLNEYDNNTLPQAKIAGIKIQDPIPSQIRNDVGSVLAKIGGRIVRENTTKNSYYLVALIPIDEFEKTLEKLSNIPDNSNDLGKITCSENISNKYQKAIHNLDLKAQWLDRFERLYQLASNNFDEATDDQLTQYLQPLIDAEYNYLQALEEHQKIQLKVKTFETITQYSTIAITILEKSVKPQVDFGRDSSNQSINNFNNPIAVLKALIFDSHEQNVQVSPDLTSGAALSNTYDTTKDSLTLKASTSF